jgi:hypothetical protein
MSRLPNFFIVGAPKAGTTSLYHYLDQHPQVYMSAIKEPHFFADEIRLENFDAALRRDVTRDAPALREFLSGPMRQKRFGGIVADWEDYLRLFTNAKNELAVGEASVCYLWSPTAPERIAKKIPGAKILVMLRDPADRAFSQYLHGLANGAIRWSFREHIRRNLHHSGGQFCVHYPFLEFGLYSEQIGRYLQLFGRNVWIGFYEDFESQPLEAFDNICRFLGVDPQFLPDMSRQHLEAQVPRLAMIAWFRRAGFWEAAARATPASLRPFIRRKLVRKRGATRMDPADRQYLLDFYRDDIRKLANLLGSNRDSWLRED